MSFESLHESVFGFGFPTFTALYAVNQIARFPSHIGFTFVLSPTEGTGYVASSVETHNICISQFWICTCFYLC